MLGQRRHTEQAPSGPPPVPSASVESEAWLSLSETVRWLRPWMAVVVALLVLATVLTAFAEDMPEFHHVAVPAAALVMAAAWAVELSGIRWPRLALILAIVLPNAWLTLIGHASVNLLFLILLVGWVGVVGTRTESTAALALALATIGLGLGRDAVGGQIAWSSWTSWLAGVLLVWMMALVLRRQERLVLELRDLRSQAEERTREIQGLYRADEALHASLRLDEVLQALVDVATDLLGADKTAVMVWDAAHERLEARAGRGFSPRPWPGWSTVPARVSPGASPRPACLSRSTTSEATRAWLGISPTPRASVRSCRCRSRWVARSSASLA